MAANQPSLLRLVFSGNVDGNFQLILIARAAAVTVDFLHGEFNPWRLYWTV